MHFWENGRFLSIRKPVYFIKGLCLSSAGRMHGYIGFKKNLWLLLMGYGVLTALHALLYKRDTGAALGWIVTALALPGIGPLLYWLLGVNRIRTRGRGWQESLHGRV
jgi:hypothetical protein